MKRKELSKFLYRVFNIYIDELCDYLYSNPGPWKDINSGLDKIYSGAINVRDGGEEATTEMRRYSDILTTKALSLEDDKNFKAKILNYAVTELRKLAYTFVFSQIGVWEIRESRQAQLEQILKEVKKGNE